VKPPSRDQAATGFSEVLDVLVRSVPEALCAVFVDPEGETVDLASRIDAFDARITGAEFAIVLSLARSCSAKLTSGTMLEFRAEGRRRSAIARVVSEGYDLVLLVASPTITARAADQVAIASQELLREAGLPSPPSFARLRGAEAPAKISSRFKGFGPVLIDDGGVQKRVEQTLGFYQGEQGTEVLVRLDDGEELLAWFDTNANRWTRRTL
jgi:predicted regulator of Ras-like GTPase activity (Roadblock/LC7/MglB family)